MGIGDWGLGIGDWGLGPIPNPQSPIPNPQSPIIIDLFNIYVYLVIINLLKQKFISKLIKYSNIKMNYLFTINHIEKNLFYKLEKIFYIFDIIIKFYSNKLHIYNQYLFFP